MYQPADSGVTGPARFVFEKLPTPLPPLRTAVNELYLADETACVEALLKQARLEDAARARIQKRATRVGGGRAPPTASPRAESRNSCANTICPPKKAWCSCAWRRRCCESRTPIPPTS